MFVCVVLVRLFWSMVLIILLALQKSLSLNAPTEVVHPFLGFVESGFPFSHNRGAAPTTMVASQVCWYFVALAQ
jgi:hypothetical protein